MKKKILWMFLSFLLVAALVLASCGPAEVVGEQEEEEEEEEEPVGEEEEEEEEPAVGVPQYGGTLIMILEWITDIGEDAWDTSTWWTGYGARHLGSPYLPFLLVGDIEKFGPRGTNEYSFEGLQWVPEKYLKGSMAESWEWTDPSTLVFHIRPGVYWAADGKEHVMESREFTAYDVEFSMNRMMKSFIDLGDESLLYIDSITAPDRYTVVIKTNKFYAKWFWHFGSGWLGPIHPEEVVEAGAGDWRNAVGTGPFILTDHVSGSQVTLVRNPNYWDTTIIDGEEYELPFIDKLIFPVIPDASTRVAALRTGALDWDTRVPLMYSESLADTCPELIQHKWLLWAGMYSFMVKQEPWTERNVRRAMMIGTDFEAIRDAIPLDGVIHGYPLSPDHPSMYTPMDELPESARVLYSNDPDLARQMLADAGYPDGLKMTMHVDPADVDGQDIVMMLIEQYARFGVEVEMVTQEWAILSGMCADGTLEDCWLGSAMMATDDPYIAFWALADPRIPEW